MGNGFIEITGFVRSVQHFNDDILLEIWDGKDKDHVTNLIINHLTILTTLTGEPLNISDELKGNYLTAFVNGRKPVLAIYPPRFYPELVAVRVDNQFGFIQYGFVDENLMIKDLNLKLNISPNTEISDSLGNPLTEDQIQNQHAFIYYSRSTRSIPAQALVTKLVVYVDPFGRMQDQKSN